MSIRCRRTGWSRNLILCRALRSVHQHLDPSQTVAETSEVYDGRFVPGEPVCVWGRDEVRRQCSRTQ
ncbi:hypothetical protein ElyMa_000384300, partial [Elysia marginata]